MSPATAFWLGVACGAIGIVAVLWGLAGAFTAAARAIPKDDCEWGADAAGDEVAHG